MQYPQIQFYRGSLVRLASGKLKQVEDLSSDDFIESARLASGNSSSSSSSSSFDFNLAINQQYNTFTATLPPSANNKNTNHLDYNNNNHCLDLVNTNTFRSQSQPQSNYCSSQLMSQPMDNAMGSVFNSPEPSGPTTAHLNNHIRHFSHSRSSYGDGSPPSMDTDDHPAQQPPVAHFNSCDVLTEKTRTNNQDEDEEDDDEIELDVVNHDEDEVEAEKRQLHSFHNSVEPQQVDDDDFYIDSSVVRDFLEVGPIVEQQQRRLASLSASSGHLHQSCTSPTSSTSSLTQVSNRPLPTMQTPDSLTLQQRHSQSGTTVTTSASGATDLSKFSSLPSTSKSSSSSSLAISPPIVTSAATVKQPETVLIKFFLETSRSIAFIEVPIEHPFFVFHRGWSSWNPQKTYDKFGLKCRKLKIGDTCISLIRKRRKKLDDPNQQQHESDQCNVLFSSIKIHE